MKEMNEKEQSFVQQKILKAADDQIKKTLVTPPPPI